MKKSSIAKATLCGGLALAIVATATVPKASSATLNAEEGLAGISITLDKYYATELETTTGDSVDASQQLAGTQLSDSSAVSGSALDQSSQLSNVGISSASEYVNIRKKASIESKVIGKLYRGAAATILSNEGEWIKVQSGECTGYVSSQFLATGLQAEEMAEEYGNRVATVNTTTLNVRKKPNTESACLTMIPIGEKYEILEDGDEWVKISIDDGDIKGYVAKQYVDVDVEFEDAVSRREEKEELRRQREAERAAREAAEAEAAAQAAAAAAEAASTEDTSSSTSSSSSSSSSSSNSSTSASTSSGSGSQVASYALQFVGNPYKWGGTSLTNGADCSGFVMSVYAHFGVSLPHSSGSQAGYGTKVSLSEAQPGDLVFYARGGSVNHVAIYIGGGQIVNAACEREGICTKSVNYRDVYCVKRILN